jgi:hypothetical protein
MGLLDQYLSIDAGTFDNWVLPRVVLDRLEATGMPRAYAAVDVWSRLRDGLANAACETATLGVPPRETAPLKRIGVGIWKDFVPTDPGGRFWYTNRIEVEISDPRSNWGGGATALVFHDVKIDPAGFACFQTDPQPTKVYGYAAHAAEVERHQAANRAAEPTETPRRSATRDDAPISNATLRAWWAMCLTIRDAEAWSHEDIRAFYDRCFPDRFLSRDRQRQLRPDGAKPGKKS